MPMIDMPLPQLQTYRGTNPKPADFDQYWDDAIAEMNATDPALTLAPADFQVPGAACFDLYFTGVRGARIHAKYLRPQNTPAPHPAILLFHGYKGNAGNWFDKLAFLQLGFSVIALDCRGQGGLSQDTGSVAGNTHHGHIIRGLNDRKENLLYRQIFLDTAQLAGLVLGFEEVDKHRVYAMGASQGGGLALACAALEPRICRLASLYPFLCDYQRVWEMDCTQQAYSELVEYFRCFDPMHLRREEIFTTLGYIDIQHLAPRIRGEVLMATALMDTVCPPSSQFAAYNNISAKKKMLVYPDFAHEALPGFDDAAARFFLY